MPISASYTWTEKKDQLKIVVNLKGTPVSKVDILVSSKTLKINFAPYFLELVLFDEVDAIKHKATVKNGDLLVTLFKKNEAVWGSLEVDAEKSKIKQIKDESIKQQQTLNEELTLQRKDKKLAEEKHSLRKQMGLDEMERNRLEILKQEEKEAAEKDVYETFAQLSKQNEAMKSKAGNVKKNKVNFTLQDNEDGGKKELEVVDESLTQPSGSSVSIFDDAEVIDVDVVSKGTIQTIESKHSSVKQQQIVDEIQDEEEEEEIKYIPPPRSLQNNNNGNNNADINNNTSNASSTKVDVNFTPRIFPTPMRESTAPSEEDWVAKNRRHLKKHGVLGKGLNGDVSEEDPVWLKAKGDDFYRNGDIRSALNAYSAALDIDDNMIVCYSNRSSCYLQLELYMECKIDCDEGINRLLKPASTATTATTATSGSSDNVTNNSNSNNHNVFTSLKAKDKCMIIKFLIRRGTCYCHLGQFSESLIDYHSANTKYQLLNGSEIEAYLSGVTIESLQSDITKLKLLSDTDNLKKEGDLLLSQNQPNDALLKYNEALALIPIHVSCLSNRSACKMSLKDYESCIEDCTSAITLLQHYINNDNSNSTKVFNSHRSNNNDANGDMLRSILPPNGSEKRKLWILKTLLRRGVAYAQLLKYDEAIEDYKYASVIDPKNEAILKDLNKFLALKASTSKS